MRAKSFKSHFGRHFSRWAKEAGGVHRNPLFFEVFLMFQERPDALDARFQSLKLIGFNTFRHKVLSKGPLNAYGQPARPPSPAAEA